MLLCQKFYLCKILSILYYSNGFKPYIYVLFFKTCSCATHIYSIGTTPKFVEYQFFGQFLELSRQFLLDMSGLWTGHIQQARHVWVSGFGLYIRGLSTPSNPDLAKTSLLSLLWRQMLSQGDLGDPPPNPFGF
jgi:hypothetical protein